jgi:hypothetical protein
MRRVGVETAAAAGLLALAVAGSVGGQTSPTGAPGGGAPGATPSKLEELLAQALRSNPDVRVAAAKVSEAEAELSRARLQVVQKVVQAYQAVEAARYTAEVRTKDLERIRKMAERQSVPTSDVEAREHALAAARRDAAAAEADLAFLVGREADAELGLAALQKWLSVRGRLAEAQTRDEEARTLEQQAAEWESRMARLRKEGRLSEAASYENEYRKRLAALRQERGTGPVADKIRQALERPVSVEFSNTALPAALDQLRTLSGILIQTAGNAGDLGDRKVMARLENVPLATVLQMLEDQMPGGLRIVVRDYGLLIAPEAQLPPGAVLLADFRKGRRDGAGPAGVGGVVKAVEANGTVVLQPGEGQTFTPRQFLHVYRQGATSTYLGEVVVVEVRGREVVARQVARAMGGGGDIQAGDRVAEKLPNR